MRPAAQYIAAGVVAAALGAAPALAQTQGSTPSGSSTQGSSTAGTAGTSTTEGTQTSQGTSASSSSTSAGVDENAAREHLSQARQALADLTKLPAASQLQGEQRTAVSNLIQAFNGLATATTDWRPKFKDVSNQLNQILGSDASGAGAAGTSGTATSGSATGSTTGDAGTAGATGASAGGYDPSIMAKLREVRMHLDGFQEASGDPTPHFDAIDEIVDAALSGAAAGGSVGTSGTASSTGTTGAASGDSVSISRAQLEEIKQHVAKLRAASEAAAARAASAGGR